ncbi:response regulator receiver protein [Magnetococcus marinus MC-1]|uniref:Response regulator receiver protein n=1 Tax=Magnetococcus marinus (strain ATCC BAA-1437 / JCM 17883 / MC-1) TaxID=156889 RepID=A0L8N9_MAGMM|nr:response regulator [Magnetococcus marinus]ABK44332.1 response regulator receiver protein [Magnetococcus marinus MC-1]
MNTIKKLTILLAEDDPITSMVAQGMLEDEGHSVVLADNGEQAAQLANLCVFDAIVMDITMPVMDGLLATRTIRQAGGPNTHTPIIGLSADDSAPQLLLAKQAGMTVLHLKPLKVEMLHQIFAPA